MNSLFRGVSNLILTKVHIYIFPFYSFLLTVNHFQDILDPNKFWHEELVKANNDRLFGCWFKTLDGVRSGVKNASLVGNISHSIVNAVEIKRKCFVVMRESRILGRRMSGPGRMVR